MKTTNTKNILNQEVIDATANLTTSRGYVCRHCSTEIIEEARNRGGFRGRIAPHFRGLWSDLRKMRQKRLLHTLRNNLTE